MVLGLFATRILQGSSIRAIVSEVPLMYGIAFWYINEIFTSLPSINFLFHP